MAVSRDYYSTATRKQRRRKQQRRSTLLVLAVFAVILLLAWGITALLQHGDKTETPSVSGGSGGVSADLLAPLPMQGGGSAGSLQSFGPAQQTAGAYTVTAYDASVIAQKECGQMDLSYFSDAVFLGDSITVGLAEFNVELGGATICGYTGISPKQIVSRATVKSAVRGDEVALDVIAAAAPKKLYVLLGTNTLTVAGAEDSFIAYYGEMLDALRQTVGEDCIIYVQSVPPVRPEVAESKPGLSSANLQTVNERLAALAHEKGCAYLNLWEAMADSDGNLNADYAENDGIHFKAGRGYSAWVSYLRTHTVYRADNPWLAGTAYAE